MPLTPETSNAPKHDIEVFRGRFPRFLKTVIEPAIHGTPIPVEIAAWQTPDPVPYADAVGATFSPVSPGFRWGPVWSTCWFRLSAMTPSPEILAGRPLDLRFSTRTEATLWHAEHQTPRPIRGLDINRDTIDLTHHLQPDPDSSLVLHIEAACNHPFGISTFDWDISDTHDRWRAADPGHLVYASLAPRNEPVRALAEVYRFASRLLDELDPTYPESRALFDALTAATHLIDDRDVAANADDARSILESSLRTPADSPPDHLGFAVAHAHIDTAWLWPLRETRRKVIRSWTNTLEVLDRNPRAAFICSQAQQYATLAEDAPSVLDRIRDRVAEGRFEPIGGMWVEPDVNVPSAESLVRQTLLGQRYWQQLFGGAGEDQTTLYLPDTFGFPASLPNIMRACGLDTFVTNKIAWNQATPYEHTNFRWHGLGGPGADTTVLAHFTPNHDYNNTNSPKELIKTKANIRTLPRKEQSPSPHGATGPHGTQVFLHPYGFGDGGGGPTIDQADAIDRLAPEPGTNPHPALPAIRHGTMAEFRSRLHDLDRALPVGLPAHEGELYLELHRATLTTHAWLKQANRDAEHALRLAELLAFAGPAGTPDAAEAVSEALVTAWRLLCLQQFHDILPGSSITPVYERCRADLARITSITDDITEAALRRWVTPSHPPEPPAQAPTQPAHWSILNPASSPVSGVVEHEQSLAFVRDLAPVSISPLRLGSPDEPVAIEDRGNAATVQNKHLRAEINAAGQIISLRLRTPAGLGPELAAEPLNRLAVYRDIPMNWDAWDLDAYTTDELLESNDVPAAEWRIKRSDPLRVEIETVRTIGENSRITQTVRLDADSPRIDIITEYDWNESHRYLRVEMPTAVCARHATYDIQAGHTQRPTTRDSQQERMMFEVCAHRWMDLSGTIDGASAGIAMLNSGRYGCGAHHHNGRTTMHLSLLRAPTHPDPTAGLDRGTITCSLMPHAGDWQLANVDREADRLNNPATALPAACAQAWSPIEIDEAPRQRLEIAAIKPAYDNPRALIVRLIETRGVAGTATIRWNLPVRTVTRTDAIERVGDGVTAGCAHEAGTTTVAVKPFEIITLLAERA